jgi:AraC family transcriptional regulator of adaptative response / DNA-3-methyladenine glycosylase II
MHEISVAAGYGSVRRFNDAFRNTYGRTPRELRKRRRDPVLSSDVISVRLPWRDPYDWDGIAAFLKGRATPGVEQVLDRCYLRTVSIDGSAGILECCPDEAAGCLRLTLHGVPTASLFQTVQKVREIFDLDAPITQISDVLRSDAQLATLLKSRPGIRVPGAWDGFELTVRAILGQQVSVQAATTLAGRIAARYGEKIPAPKSRDSLVGPHLMQADKNREINKPSRVLVFPRAKRLARARFNGMGLVQSRIDTIRRVAQAVCEGSLNFEQAQSPDEFYGSLVAIKGIGDWTAQYVAMRALKNPDAFPAADLGLLKAVGESGTAGVKNLRNRAQAWSPWRSYAAMLLWTSLENSGG